MTDWRKIVPGVVVSLLALAIIFYFVDLGQLWQALRLADFRYVALLLAISLGWLMVRAVLWRTLLQNKAPYGAVFLTLNQGYLLNNVLPFRLGEVGRAFLLSRKVPGQLSFFEVLSSILIERSMDVGMAAGLLLVSLSFVIGDESDSARPAAMAAGGLVLLGLGLLYLLARKRAWALGIFERLAARLPLLARLGGAPLNAFFNGLAVITDSRRFLLAVTLLLLNWGIAVMQFYVLLRAFFPQATLLWAAFSLGVMALGVALPSSPGSIGVMEAAIMGALAVFVNDPSTALAAAITAHLSNYLITGLIGIYALGRDGLSLSGVYRDVRRIPSQSPDAPAIPPTDE